MCIMGPRKSKFKETRFQRSKRAGLEEKKRGGLKELGSVLVCGRMVANGNFKFLKCFNSNTSEYLWKALLMAFLNYASHTHGYPRSLTHMITCTSVLFWLGKPVSAIQNMEAEAANFMNVLYNTSTKMAKRQGVLFENTNRARSVCLASCM